MKRERGTEPNTAQVVNICLSEDLDMEPKEKERESLYSKNPWAARRVLEEGRWVFLNN